MRSIAGKAIREDAVDDRRVGPATYVGEEPETIPLDRAAHAIARIPVRAQRGRLRNAQRPKLVVHVVPRRPVTRDAVERRPAEVVTAGLGDDVDARPSGLGFG